MKLGSLFDGSGGFPLAGAMCGIEPVWASEVEPYPIAVTRERFPNMKHLGDISKINGAKIEPVDVVTFGFPCQSVSVAGKREGVKHKDKGDEETTRSGLFWEAVRIIKEMRGATNGEYPRFAVFENVPGLFSADNGEAFRTVLEGLIQIVEPNAVMPEVPKKGWAYADCYSGDGFSLAYRVFDAQYIRTAQRRRRVYACLDLRGQCARQILFERESLRGYFTQSGTPWQTVAASAEGSVGADDREGACFGFPLGFRPENVRLYDEKATTLCNGTRAGFCNGVVVGYDGYNQTLTGDKTMSITGAASDIHHVPGVVYSAENHPADSRVNLDESGKVQTLTSRMGTGGGNVPMVLEPFCKSSSARSAEDATTWKHAEVANTLNTFDQGEARANELVVYCLQGNGIDRSDTAGCNGKGWRERQSYTLNTIDRPAVVYALDRAFYNQGKNVLYEPQCYEDGTNPTLVAKGPSAVCHANGNGQADNTGLHEIPGALNCMHDQQAVLIEQDTRYIVRRLTPTECARLQGFPDTWGHIDLKDDFTEQEYKFWLNVRNAHAEIYGKEVKDYTKKQMLAWYNKLWTDSAEYKMWGNGIALPCALYVMQGIAERI